MTEGVGHAYRSGEWEGWDEERAAKEQRFLMEKVNRGEWTPAPAQSASTFADAIVPTFRSRRRNGFTAASS